MNQDRESFAGQKELITDPIAKAEREAANAVEQFDRVLSYVQKTDPDFKLTARIITELQEVVLKGLHPLAGTYRNTPVTIRGSKHAPPDHLDVPDEIGKLCSYINAKWKEATAIHLGAYALWRINWIHPYADGNGRTARAVSYLLMSKKFGSVLPGTPTIPDQISVDKGPYYDALEAADANSTEEKVDVSQLEAMLEGLLVKQLLSRASIPEVAANKLAGLFEKRIAAAPGELIKAVFGSDDPSSQLWAIGDYVILQIADKAAIEAAEIRQRTYRTPFPRLLAFGETPHVYHVTANKRLSTLVLDEKLDERHAVLIDRDCSVSIQPKNIQLVGGESWSSEGWLYIVRLGSELTSISFPDNIDLLIARQLNRAADK